MRILDLFCGAGGAAMGLSQAFPGAEIVGVDIKPQPRYPFRFFRDDAIVVLANLARGDYLITDWWPDFIWASPPCQKYSAATRHLAKETPKLIDPLRRLLEFHGTPYCIENTLGAPLRNPVTLCGLSFGLNVKRHRLFETNFPVTPIPCVPGHPGNWLVIFGHECRDRSHGHAAGRKNKLADGRAAMQIDWMSRGELSEAIPPAYSRYIGEQFKLTQQKETNVSKKQSAEARVIEWFEQAPLATAEIVLGIVRSRMKTRAKASEPVAVKHPIPRKRKVTRTPSPATSFPPSEATQ